MRIFKNLRSFSIFFFILLIVDICLKINDLQLPYRYFTKSGLIISLTIYYFYNKTGVISSTKDKFTYLGLSLFFLSDLVLIEVNNNVVFVFGLSTIVFAKLLYSIRFSNSIDFNMAKLLPLFVICTAYVIFIILLVYEDLGAFFIPVLFYLFASLILILFAYLRKNVVCKQSFYMVGFGVFFFVICDTYGLLGTFYRGDLIDTKFIIMFSYGIAQYLVIVGLTKEKLLDNK